MRKIVRLIRNTKIEYIILRETIKYVHESYQRHGSIKETWKWTFGKNSRYKLNDNGPWIHNNTYMAMRKLYR